MAKGRKLTSSLSEHYLGTYTYGHADHHAAPAFTEVSDLGEEFVWSMVDDDQMNTYSSTDWSFKEESQNSDRHRRCENHASGLSLALDAYGKTTSSRVLHQYRTNAIASPRGRQMATSAPVNVPDWSKILRVDSVDSLPDSDDGLDDRDWETMPPHEYLARSRSTATTSVFQGVGRTLKGRDLSRVRDAVWSQTGFDG